MKIGSVLITGALFCAPAMYGTSVYTAAGNLNNGDPINAQAAFTFGAGTLQIVLSNLVIDQHDIGQDLSGISFTLGGISGDTIGLVSSFSGTDRSSITPGMPSGWADSSDSTNHWFLTNSAGNFDLTAPANPAGDYTIVGGPNGNDMYTHADTSVDDHMLLAVTATWNFNVPGVTAATADEIYHVTFFFGTAPNQAHLPGELTDISDVPEPLSFALVGGGLLLIGLRRKFPG